MSPSPGAWQNNSGLAGTLVHLIQQGPEWALLGWQHLVQVRPFGGGSFTSCAGAAATSATSRLGEITEAVIVCGEVTAATVTEAETEVQEEFVEAGGDGGAAALAAW